jgi:hypothetical protein
MAAPGVKFVFLRSSLFDQVRTVGYGRGAAIVSATLTTDRAQFVSEVYRLGDVDNGLCTARF